MNRDGEQKSSLSRLEADVAAKNRARPSSSTSSSTATPGAHSSSTNGYNELSRLEADVAAKNRARPSSSSTSTATPGSYNELSRLEADVAAKNRARPSSSSSSTSTATRNRLESDVASKNRASSLDSVVSKKRARTSTSSSTPGAHRVGPGPGLSSLEADVAAKNQTRPRSTILHTETRTELSRLEAEVVKNNNNNHHHDSSGQIMKAAKRLEADIMAKNSARRVSMPLSSSTTIPGAHSSYHTNTNVREEVSYHSEDYAARNRAIRRLSSNNNSSSSSCMIGDRRRSTGDSLKTMEDDLIAKNRARLPVVNDNTAKNGVVSSLSTTASSPGAHAVVVNSSTSHRDSLARLETFLADKRGAMPTTRIGSVVVPLHRLEADVDAKNKARLSTTPGAHPIVTMAEKNKAPLTDLSRLQADVLAKNKATSNNVVLMLPSEGCSPSGHLSTLESDIIAKERARPSSSSSRNNNRRNLAVVSSIPLSFPSEELTPEVSKPKSSSSSSNNNDDVCQQKIESQPSSTLRKMMDGFSNHRRSFNATTKNENKKKGDDIETTFTECEGGGGTLAVAIAVDENDDDDDLVGIQAATKYNPNSKKPPLYKKVIRRFRWYGVCVLIVFVVLMITSVWFIMGKIAAVTATIMPPPTASPTTLRETIGIREVLSQKLLFLDDQSPLEDPASHESKALDWIINEDPMQLPSNATNLVQRYLLAYHYFHTSTKGPWYSCNPPTGMQTSACTFTHYAAHLNTIVPYKKIASRWLSEKSECLWGGVHCDSGKVTKLKLENQTLTGTFPDKLVNMPDLQFMELRDNQLSGQLPSELTQMEHLVKFCVHSNLFTGTIPPEWFDLKLIKGIELSNNHIYGSFPTNLDQLTTLVHLKLNQNKFAGTIPPTLFQIPNLKTFAASGNQIRGSIPTEIGLATQLQELELSDNAITGSIPSEIGNTDLLENFHMENNQLHGTIPEEMYHHLRDMRKLTLSNNQLEGTISKYIAHMTKLYALYLDNNQFSGTIPSEMRKLVLIRDVMLQQNHFMGAIPLEFCTLKGPTRLHRLIADCSPSSRDTNGLPSLVCPTGCCTVCCDTDTGFCDGMVD